MLLAVEGDADRLVEDDGLAQLPAGVGGVVGLAPVAGEDPVAQLLSAAVGGR